MTYEDIYLIQECQNKIPVIVSHIAEQYNIKVYDIDMPDNISGAIIKDNNKYSIYVNRAHHDNRKKFTIAHEIAHYLLHKDKIGDNLTDNAMYRSHLSTPLEKDANRLASEILMPQQYIEQFISEDLSIKEMAYKFKVSEEAIRIRLIQGKNKFLI